MRSPYAHNCITVNNACQGIFVCYIILVMKAVSTIAVLCILAVFVACKPNQAARREATKSKEESPISVALAGNQKSADTYNQANHDTPEWCAAFKRPEWWGICIGILTLGVITWQSIQTKIAAQAAASNAQAIVDSERAWLIAELVPTAIKFSGRWYKPVGNNMGELSEADLSDGKQFEYRLKVTNMGKTPAFITRWTINRSAGSDEGQLIDSGLPYQPLESGGHRHFYALDVEHEASNYSPADQVFFFGNISFEHVFGKGKTIREPFCYFLKRETGRLERMPMRAEGSAPKQD